jgi:hypothetical protein
MLTGSASWRALEAEFRTLQGPIRLIATLDRHWFFSRDWADGACPVPFVQPDQTMSDKLQSRFEALARRAGIDAGETNHELARDSWLNHLLDQGLYVSLFHGTRDGRRYTGKRIDDVVVASAECCHVCKNRALELEIGISPRASGRGAYGATPRSGFWKERQAEFEKYQKQYSDLKAHWKAGYAKWLLWWGSTPDGIHIPQECKDVFNAIARKTATELPGSGVAGHAEPSCRWLDFMRASKWGFQVTGNVPCTEWEWDAGVKEGKPLAEVRREQKYTTGDEWEKVYRRTKGGKLRRLSARELEGKSSEDLQKYYHWLENGTIEHVFESSARLCEDLAARAFESEVTTLRAPDFAYQYPKGLLPAEEMAIETALRDAGRQIQAKRVSSCGFRRRKSLIPI